MLAKEVSDYFGLGHEGSSHYVVDQVLSEPAVLFEGIFKGEMLDLSVLGDCCAGLEDRMLQCIQHLLLL